MDDGKMAQDVRGAAGATEVAAAAADVRADARPAGAPEAALPAADGADAARERLTSADVSVFCEGMAMMLAAGIQVDEALSLLDIRRASARLSCVCEEAYRAVLSGCGLAEAMRRTGAFPRHAVDMVAVGERTGRLEQTLRRLTSYYDEESRVFAKVRTAVGYPAALLCVMSVILAFTVIGILPVFLGVYDELAGGLAGGSFAAVGAAVAVGWVALVLTLAVTACALVGSAAVRTPRGQARILALLERLPVTRPAMYQLALSRFSAAASAYLASGADSNTAMREALRVVDHPVLHERLERAHDAMVDPARALQPSRRP